MPVDFEAHEPGNPRVDLSEGTKARGMLEFLLKTPTVGYTSAEIANETGIPRDSVGPTLHRLEAAGLVRRKNPYWAAPEDDRIAAATASLLGIETAVSTYSDDWYARNAGWAEELPDLSDEEQSVAYSQGAIVVAEDAFGNTPKRQQLILSNDRVLFNRQEYVAAVITTTGQPAAVELTDNRIERGGILRTSYMSRWPVLTLKDWMITKRPAEATDTTVGEVRQELNAYLQTG